MNSLAALTNRMRAPISVALVLLFGLTSPAAAAGFTDFLNNVVVEFNTARRPIAIIAIMVVGIVWQLNVIDMRRAGQVIVGVIIVFSAVEILDLITA